MRIIVTRINDSKKVSSNYKVWDIFYLSPEKKIDLIERINHYSIFPKIFVIGINNFFFSQQTFIEWFFAQCFQSAGTPS